MISEISIQNFKSVEKLTLPLGRVNVFIGENGAGKSNILEGVGLLSAAAAKKLDDEFLVSRGVRVSNGMLMCSAFERKQEPTQASFGVVKLAAREGNESVYATRLVVVSRVGDRIFDHWMELPELPVENKAKFLEGTSEVHWDQARKAYAELRVDLAESGMPSNYLEKSFPEQDESQIRNLLLYNLIFASNRIADEKLGLSRFLIYSPENVTLRRFEEEGQIQPVGIRGEGLFKMLQTFGREDYADRLAELKESLELIGWFLDFRVPANLAPGESRLQIIDRFLGNDIPLDQRSANEGFLFLLFYFAVFLSKSTPAFFAIDNVDASLNPRLCAELMRRLVELAKKYDKQVILTTHNPAILDGLNLLDEDQRLFSIYRTHEGRTQARRIASPRPQPDEMPVRLSEAFLRGLLGGVPKNF